MIKAEWEAARKLGKMVNGRINGIEYGGYLYREYFYVVIGSSKRKYEARNVGGLRNLVKTES